jgi:hypothetical protein
VSTRRVALSSSGILRDVTFDFSTADERLATVLECPAGIPRGKALEDLVADMFAAVPGISIADRNVLSGQGDAELDLLLANAPTDGGLDAFGRDILVECKSSQDPLSSRDLNHFATQAKLRDLRWSIVVSLAGLTGDEEDLRAAQQVVRDNATSRCGILLIVEHELRAIRSAAHLVNVVERKRQKMVSRMRAETFSVSELRALDPDRGIRRGGIQAAVRRLRRTQSETSSSAPLSSRASTPTLASSALGPSSRILRRQYRNTRTVPSMIRCGARFTIKSSRSVLRSSRCSMSCRLI